MSPAASVALTLLGDSTLDNLRHTGPPDLAQQLRERLPESVTVHLCAVDGARAADVALQLARLPHDTTHLLLSVGGNDVLARGRLLRASLPNLGTALGHLAAVRSEFARDYRRALGEVVALGLPTAVCTVYEPRFALAARQRIFSCLIALFNDVIISAAVEFALPVLDLRPLAAHPDVFLSEIEFNHRGARRFAEAVARLLEADGFGRGATRLQAAG